MALRQRRGRRISEVETAEPANLPDPTPAPERAVLDVAGETLQAFVAKHLVDTPAKKNPADTQFKGQRAIEAASKGGRVRAERQARLRLIAGDDTPIRQSSEHYPYLKAAEEYFLTRIEQVAKDIGGGYVAPDVIACIAQEARCLMWSNYYSDQMRVDMALKHGEAMARFSRQTFEYAARYAKARPKNDDDPGASLMIPVHGGDGSEDDDE